MSTNQVLAIIGFGPGISNSVAERWAKNGYALALIGRTQSKLDAAVSAFKERGITASAFTADANQPETIRAALKRVSSELGSIHAFLWNAFPIENVGFNLLSDEPSKLLNAFNMPVTGLLSAVQESLSDLKSNKGVVLVTNGALAENNEAMDAMSNNWHLEALALGNAAKSKLVGLLRNKLQDDGVFVCEVLVAGVVTGTSFDQGQPGTIDPTRIADAFWQLAEQRTEIRTRVQ